MLREQIEDSLLNPIIETLRQLLERINNQKSIAEAVFDQITPERDPRDFGGACFDQKVEVGEIEFREDPKKLRQQLGSWDAEGFRELIKSIRLSTEELGVLKKITSNMVTVMTHRAQPLYRPVDVASTAQNASTIKTITIPTSDKVKLNEKGNVIEAEIPLPAGYVPYPVPKEQDLCISTEVHGESLMNDAFFVKSLKDFLALPPSDREKYFWYSGDMEALLPPFAKALAEMELGDTGGREGDIAACTGEKCGIEFYRNSKEKSDNTDKCPGCRNKQNGITK